MGVSVNENGRVVVHNQSALLLDPAERLEQIGVADSVDIGEATEPSLFHFKIAAKVRIFMKPASNLSEIFSEMTFICVSLV